MSEEQTLVDWGAYTEIQKGALMETVIDAVEKKTLGELKSENYFIFYNIKFFI